MKGRSRKTGFTLVELIAAVAAAAVLVLAVAATLLFAYRGWARIRGAVDLQRDGTVALEALRYAVRGAAPADVSLAGSRIEVAGSGATVAIYQSGDSLMLDPDTGAAGDEQRLVHGRLTAFVPAKVNQSVTVQLSLREGDDRFEATETVHCRN